MTDFGFKKEEKLKSSLAITKLFENGKHHSQMPLRIIWLCDPSGRPVPVKAGVSVSKRNFNRAVDRNRIKRKLREAYRINKYVLTEICREKNVALDLMIIYTGRTEKEFREIEALMKKLLGHVASKI